jgi:hypothetical protein
MACCCVLRKYAKLCLKFGVATARAFTLSAVAIGGTVCKNLRSYYTLDSVFNCYICFLVEYYKTSFKLCVAATWCVVRTGGGVLSLNDFHTRHSAHGK